MLKSFLQRANTSCLCLMEEISPCGWGSLSMFQSRSYTAPGVTFMPKGFGILPASTWLQLTLLFFSDNSWRSAHKMSAVAGQWHLPGHQNTVTQLHLGAPRMDKHLLTSQSATAGENVKEIQDNCKSMREEKWCMRNCKTETEKAFYWWKRRWRNSKNGSHSCCSWREKTRILWMLKSRCFLHSKNAVKNKNRLRDKTTTLL